MSRAEEYSIRLKDLKEGRHEYCFNLDNTFFEESDNDIFSRGKIQCDVVLEKHSALMRMELSLKGAIQVACDRCGVQIDLPVSEVFDLVIKQEDHATEEEKQEMEKEGVLLIGEEVVEFDLSRHLRDFSLLMVPSKRVYECRKEQPYPCDEVVLERIGFFEPERISSKTDNPMWDALKDIQWEE